MLSENVNVARSSDTATQTPADFLWSKKRYISSFAQVQVYGPHPVQNRHLLVLFHQYRNFLHLPKVFN